MILEPLFDLTFLYELAATVVGTSNRRRWELQYFGGGRLRLLELRGMAGLCDRGDKGVGDEASVALEIIGRHETVAVAAQEKRRRAHPVQPVLELRVVHVGFPRDQRERFAIARHNGDRANRHISMSIWHTATPQDATKNRVRKSLNRRLPRPFAAANRAGKAGRTALAVAYGAMSRTIPVKIRS